MLHALQPITSRIRPAAIPYRDTKSAKYTPWVPKKGTLDDPTTSSHATKPKPTIFPAPKEIVTQTVQSVHCYM